MLDAASLAEEEAVGRTGGEEENGWARVNGEGEGSLESFRGMLSTVVVQYSNTTALRPQKDIPDTSPMQGLTSLQPVLVRVVPWLPSPASIDAQGHSRECGCDGHQSFTTSS